MSIDAIYFSCLYMQMSSHCFINISENNQARWSLTLSIYTMVFMINECNKIYFDNVRIKNYHKIFRLGAILCQIRGTGMIASSDNFLLLWP